MHPSLAFNAPRNAGSNGREISGNNNNLGATNSVGTVGNNTNGLSGAGVNASNSVGTAGGMHF